MVVYSMITTLQENLLDSSWLEAVAVVFGLLSVWYARKENILVYPTGIVNVLIYVYLCFNVKLYADAGINLFYFAMSIYGWYMWVRKDAQRHVRPISKATAGLWAGSIMAALVFFAILSYVLKTYTDSSVPYWDGLTTAIFIVGMWLMALKKVENWIFWIAGDLISVPLYASKGLILSGIQFAVFLALAIAGLIAWERKYREIKKEWSGVSP